MKKGLLLALGVTVSLGVSAQAPKISGVHKVDLNNSKATTVDGSSVNFFASANAAHRNANPTTVQTQGFKFTSSYNAFTLLVSNSHCITANQSLGAVMFTHRISQDWAADANVASGYCEYSWTTNFGVSWDSSYFADQTTLGNKRFRYPSGAIINPAGNTSVANAVNVATGPYTDGSGWKGYYANDQMMVNGASSNTIVTTNAPNGPNRLDFPRISMSGYADSSAWVTGGLYANGTATTALAQDYRGMAMMKAKWNGTSVNWIFDSIKPSFHQDAAGTNDCFTEAYTTFSDNGVNGYAVFFGVPAAATTSQTRTFSPIVYKTMNSGATWTLQAVNDFTTLPQITDHLIQATDGNFKPWFDQSQGADIAIDANNQLHILCTISSGSSDDNDSLGYAYTLTGQSGTTARHFIYDVHTTSTGWDAWLIDSLMTSTSTTNTIFVDGSNSGAAFATDARLQLSHTTDGSKMFYVWVDSDPTALGGENAIPDLFGKGVDVNTNMATARVQFTTSQDFYFHYISNIALVAGSTYKIGCTNSIDRSGGNDVATTFDHYWFEQVIFNDNQFTIPVVASVQEIGNGIGSFNTYPNPANDVVNVNIDLTNSASVTLSLVNELGQVVLTNNRMLNSGKNSVQLNTSNIAPGVYFLNITSNNSRATSKIVIQ